MKFLGKQICAISVVGDTCVDKDIMYDIWPEFKIHAIKYSPGRTKMTLCVARCWRQGDKKTGEVI